MNLEFQKANENLNAKLLSEQELKAKAAEDVAAARTECKASKMQAQLVEDEVEEQQRMLSLLPSADEIDAKAQALKTEIEALKLEMSHLQEEVSFPFLQNKRS